MMRLARKSAGRLSTSRRWVVALDRVVGHRHAGLARSEQRPRAQAKATLRPRQTCAIIRSVTCTGSGRSMAGRHRCGTVGLFPGAGVLGLPSGPRATPAPVPRPLAAHRTHGRNEQGRRHNPEQQDDVGMALALAMSGLRSPPPGRDDTAGVGMRRGPGTRVTLVPRRQRPHATSPRDACQGPSRSHATHRARRSGPEMTTRAQGTTYGRLSARSRSERASVGAGRVGRTARSASRAAGVASDERQVSVPAAGRRCGRPARRRPGAWGGGGGVRCRWR